MLQRLERQGVFTTGLLLEVSETRTRRQTLADQIYATTNDVNDWRDEALLLNLASFGVDEHRLFTQAGIIGLGQLLALDREALGERLGRAARTLGMDPPPEITDRRLVSPGTHPGGRVGRFVRPSTGDGRHG